MEFNADKNAERFTGFAKVYNDARPQMPEYAAEVITDYMMRKPELVVDLGCGTGLSTLIWQNRCNHVIGIEPSGDMLKIATGKQNDTISFIKAYANNTTLESNSADVVVCSQSFHWMEPAETLSEINRILKTGGIFATVDCDWPPVCNWEAELAYNRLSEKVTEALNKRNDKSVYKWDKDLHLTNIQNSGYFRYCREIVFCHREKGDAKRLVELAKSQGGLQTLLRTEPEAIATQIQEFENKLESLSQKIMHFDFCYRMRIGVK